jgi:hypothetical protein
MVQPTKMLSHVNEGSDVYDAHGQRVGTVKYVHVGEMQLASESGLSPYLEAAQADVPEDIDKLLSRSGLEPEVRERLLSSGFLYIDTGLLRADRLVTPPKIADVAEDRVELNVTKDDLIRV